jgi:hypothetical protein
VAWAPSRIWEKPQPIPCQQKKSSMKIETARTASRSKMSPASGGGSDRASLDRIQTAKAADTNMGAMPEMGTDEREVRPWTMQIGKAIMKRIMLMMRRVRSLMPILAVGESATAMECLEMERGKAAVGWCHCRIVWPLLSLPRIARSERCVRGMYYKIT